MRNCIFCGSRPVKKNKEHVLPQWLLRMTGDPSRVVPIARSSEFSWASLVMPSCTTCNERYSRLEADVKLIVEALVERASIEAGAYRKLLDWLDKVRVGLWLTYNVLQASHTNVEPSFYINSRVGTKDRFVAVYPFSGKGLNAFGVESLVFNRTPSCFALRVNDLLLLNASADFLLAKRCGFPFPRDLQLMLDGPDGGKLSASDFGCTRRIKRPILRFKLYKPCVLLFQPIMQVAADRYDFTKHVEEIDSFLAENTLPPHPSVHGILIREYPDRVECIKDLQQPIAFCL